MKLANQATTIYGYDNLGRQTLFEDANGNKATYAYDLYGRLANKSFSDTRVATVGYT